MKFFPDIANSSLKACHAQVKGAEKKGTDRGEGEEEREKQTETQAQTQTDTGIDTVTER